MLYPDKTSSLLDGFSCQTRSNNRQSKAPKSALLVDIGAEKESVVVSGTRLGFCICVLILRHMTFFVDCWFSSRRAPLPTNRHP